MATRGLYCSSKATVSYLNKYARCSLSAGCTKSNVSFAKKLSVKQKLRLLRLHNDCSIGEEGKGILIPKENIKFLFTHGKL